MFKRFKFSRWCLFLFLSVAIVGGAYAQNPWNGKVVLQGFWWDYRNDNFNGKWADYLAELAPRLRDLGIDAVWVPPVSKGFSGNTDVGYGIYDHYDLGDKFQKGSTATRLGTKNELLRMVAVMHANGLDVVFDIVLNHIIGAETQDPQSWNDPWTNFRYACYATPFDTTNLSGLTGRWSKNWQNFHPNPDHNASHDDITSQLFGPDICYYSNAFGLSSNATYNPAQSADHMRNNARAWLIWLKKQTAFDGIRMDAVKHYPAWAAEDFLWNLQFGAGWANGGSQMFAVGEFVGSKQQIDDWATAVQNRAGTFDFPLRQSLHDMVYSLGGYDLGSIPGAQQTNRTRTVPFVNNHDTFRPVLDSLSGNYTGWDTGNELGGGHIEPNEPRLAAAYAIAFAVDGSPQVFFEDLFDVGYTGKRFSHLPANTTDLPVRDEIANIIWCHQKLEFKNGAYIVRHQSPDHLIIERSGKAIIGVNDNWSQWQSQWIPTNFAPWTQLHDYSGANANDIWVNGSGWVQIWTPPNDGSNLRRGYTIWGPAGISGGFSPAERTTTQEWEMADDLGDAHTSSLQQGGQLPANSTALRTVGKIYSAAAKPITVEVYPEATGWSKEVQLLNNTGSVLDSDSGTGNLTLTYTPSSEGYFTLKVKNKSNANPAQRVWVKATYTAPVTIDTRLAKRSSILADHALKPEIVELIGAYPNPFNPSTRVDFQLQKRLYVQLTVYNVLGQRVRTLVDNVLDAGKHAVVFDGAGLNSGLYFVSLRAGGKTLTRKVTLLK